MEELEAEQEAKVRETLEEEGKLEWKEDEKGKAGK